MLGWTVPTEEICQNLEYVVRSSPPSHLDRQTLPRVLVEYRQKFQDAAIVRSCAHEVIRPDVILVQHPEPNAGAVVQPQPTPLGLALGHLQAFLTPDPLHPLVVHGPPIDAQQVRDLPVPVATETARQPHHVPQERPPRRERTFLIRRCVVRGWPSTRHARLTPLSRSTESTSLTCPIAIRLAAFAQKCPEPREPPMRRHVPQPLHTGGLEADVGVKAASDGAVDDGLLLLLQKRNQLLLGADVAPYAPVGVVEGSGRWRLVQAEEGERWPFHP